MKKTAVLVAALAGLSTSALYAQDSGAPMLEQGTKELALSGTIEFPELEEIDFDIDASFGYFFRDGWEAGVRAVGADLGGVERFDFSGFTEYNFNRGTDIVPFVGASVGFASVSYDEGTFDGETTLDRGDDNATVFAIQAGVKWFVRPYMAISTSISFNASSEDIYATDDNLKDNLTRFRIGLRYYF